MKCRNSCGACCIIPSISSLGKEAFKACVHLTQDLKCKLFDSPERPKVCSSLKPSIEMCGHSKQEAEQILTKLEILTRPKN